MIGLLLAAAVFTAAPDPTPTDPPPVVQLEPNEGCPNGAGDWEQPPPGELASTGPVSLEVAALSVAFMMTGATAVGASRALRGRRDGR